MPISSRRVPPSYPADGSKAAIAFIGEGPGAEEDKYLKAFIGKSGKVLWEMAGEYAGIERGEVYVDNLSPFRLTDNRGKDRAPTSAEFDLFAPELRKRIARVDPALIVTLGRWSTSALLRRPVLMEVVHGQLHRTRRGRALIPNFHPAAGLHDPGMLAFTAHDLKQVGRYLRGKKIKEAPLDEHPEPVYITITGKKSKRWWWRELSPVIALDTEFDPVTGEPWCVTVCARPGRAFLIRADDAPALASLRLALRFNNPEILLHFALADIEPLRRMGIDLIAMRMCIRDTGIQLFHRQLDPQGLKRAAPRLAGMQLRDYEDVVGPYAEQFARNYVLHALEEPEGSWGIPEGRKHSVVKRLEGLLNPRPPRAGSEDEARTLRAKWADKKFTPIREKVEAAHGALWRPGFDDIPEKEFRAYACGDSDATRRLYRTLHGSEQKRFRELTEVDHGILPIVDRMQQVGLRVDTQRLDELRTFVAEELDAYLEIIRTLVGREDFNPGSGDQVAAWARAMGLGLVKLTRGGKREQVDENALIAIRYSHPAIDPILTYRELDKLRGTYIEPLYGLLVGRGRYRYLYGHFRLTAAVTGRLAMFDPNLMAFPTRTEVGRRIRRCFVARPGKRIGSCDLSQIELRVGAALSQDERMVDAFVRGADLHTETARAMFDKPEPAKISEELERYPAKTTNFAMFFGATGRRLNMEFLKAGIPGWTEEKCNEFVEKWFTIYTGVRTWIDATCAQGARLGFVTTAVGRRRYLPALRFQRNDYPFNRIREEAQRQASNFPVQGTAQEVEKRGMRVVWDEVLPAVQSAGFYMEPLLQIHDDLMTEFDEGAEPMVKELMLEAMTRESPWRGVPLRASWKSGLDWGSLKAA